MAPKEHVFVLYEATEDGDFDLIEAYKTNDDAKAAVKELQSNGSVIEIKKLELKSEAAASKAKAKSGASKAKGGQKAKSSEPDDEGNDSKNDAKNASKTIPEGKPNVLKGLSVLFTGTLSIDRKTCEAAAKKYGAKIVSKLEDTDYIILGTKPGPQKVKTIEEKGLDTISEDDFYDMLQTGVPQEKLDQVAAKADSEPPAKKQKK